MKFERDVKLIADAVIYLRFWSRSRIYVRVDNSTMRMNSEHVTKTESKKIVRSFVANFITFHNGYV